MTKPGVLGPTSDDAGHDSADECDANDDDRDDGDAYYYAAGSEPGDGENW